MTWNPTQYLMFQNHRLRPALDLIQRIPLESPKQIVDLGCGTGNVIPFLRHRWPGAKILGVDGSVEMLELARSSDSLTQWELSDIPSWQSGNPVDLLFSNAALQWLDEHELVFPRLLKQIAPQGVLAVQMSRNFSQPSHTAIFEVIREGAWSERLQPLMRPEPCKSVEFYWNLLSPHVETLDIWETVYLYVLEGENPVADFVKGSWLPQFLEVLEGSERQAFEAEYRRRVKLAYPSTKSGKTLFPFRRLFVVATKK